MVSDQTEQFDVRRLVVHPKREPVKQYNEIQKFMRKHTHTHTHTLENIQRFSRFN